MGATALCLLALQLIVRSETYTQECMLKSVSSQETKTGFICNDRRDLVRASRLLQFFNVT